MKVVILAGGLGSRLSEETVLRPKPMIEIGGKPILWSFGTRDGDNRSYRVSFDKIRRLLPDLRCRHAAPFWSDEATGP